MRTKILMCDPDNFDVTYEINPWMDTKHQKVNVDLAKLQWNNLYKIIKKIADVVVMKSQTGVPDLIFTANAGVIAKDKFVVSNFKYAPRKNEEKFYTEIAHELNFDVLANFQFIFEGAGDALYAHNKLWCGFGYRTSLNGFDELSAVLNVVIKPLELVDDRFYHLDTCFCPLTNGYLMYYPGAFSKSANIEINACFDKEKIFIVDEQDAILFACNAVSIDNQIIVNSMSKDLEERLNAKGFEVHETALSEFMKAGGSAKCLTLKLNEIY